MDGCKDYQFRSEKGLVVQLRELQPQDAPHLLDLFAHMGPESRYLRFNIPLESPDPDWIRQQAASLAIIEPGQGAGWLAFADLPGSPGSCIGGVRYVIIDDQTAEMSVAVRDDLQGQGIGTALLQHAASSARQRGLRKVRAHVKSTNLPVLHLLKGLEVPLQFHKEGADMTIEVELNDAVDTGHMGTVLEPPQG